MGSMNFRQLWFVVRTVAIAVFVTQAFANQCDCQQVTGKCTGAIEVTKTFGSEPSFGAEITVHSSEKVCSKVEYYVNNTLYQTLLVNRSADSDSVFGTRPIQAQDVRYSACYVCKRTDESRSESAGNDIQQANGIEGAWTGYTSWLFFKQAAKFVFSAPDGKIAGTYIHPKLGPRPVYDATFEGGILKFKSDVPDGTVQFILQVSGNSATGSAVVSGMNGSITINRK